MSNTPPTARQPLPRDDSPAPRPVWILALDGSLACCSAALLADGELRAERVVPGERGHPSTLPALARAVLAEAGIAAPELDAVAAVVGPGGFTGLRAALALAQGIALAAGVPCLGVTTGEALAAALPMALRQARTVWTVVDARRGRVALERFEPGAWHPLGPPEVLDEESLPRPTWPLALAGDAAATIAARLSARGEDALLTDSRLPHAAAVARVAALRLAGRIPPLPAQPLYMEPPAARLPAGAAG